MLLLACDDGWRQNGWDEIMEELITVIIPVYNVEVYLEKCLRSVTGQTYQNLEIILVDDGSTDSSAQICDKWAEKDPRICVIHKQNGGQAQARNRGLEISTGEYILFVDADDYVDAHYTGYLYGLAKQNDAEIAVCGFRLVTTEGTNLNRLNTDSDVRIMDQHDALRELCHDRWITCSPWAKLFKRSVIGDIRFPEGHIYEDVATVYRWIMNASRVALGYEWLYYYVEHSGSTVTSAFHQRRMDAAVFAEQMCNAIVAKYPDLHADTQRRLFIEYMYLLRSLSLSRTKSYEMEKYAQELYMKIRQTRQKAWNVGLTWKHRFYAVCSLFGRKALQTGFWLESFVYRLVKYR